MDGFLEGNVCQFTWFVSNDAGGLIEKMGKYLFNERLENTFYESQKSVFMRERNSKFFWHSNIVQQREPVLFVPVRLVQLFEKTLVIKNRTRRICNEFYRKDPLHGVMDMDRMKTRKLVAWFIMAALGLFDAKGQTADNPTFSVWQFFVWKSNHFLRKQPG